MKAARIAKYGGPEVISLADIDRPIARAGQVLVRVHASSINPVDIAIREGRLTAVHALRLPLTLGCDLAGVIIAVGPEVSGFVVGDEVFGSAAVAAGASGAFAEVAAVPASLLAKKPAGLSFVEAAALALAGTSAVQAIEDHLQLRRGQRILIHGGAGGIGSCAIQVAKRLGAHVTATTSSGSLAYVRELGADDVIDYTLRDFTIRGPMFDAVLDVVGGDVYLRSFAILRRGGAIVSMKQPVDGPMMAQHGVKAFFEITRIRTEDLDRLRQHVERGDLKIRVERTFTLLQIGEALAAKKHGHVRGKLAIAVASELGPNTTRTRTITLRRTA
jgi:alcohol dehydrogenase